MKRVKEMPNFVLILAHPPLHSLLEEREEEAVVGVEGEEEEEEKEKEG
jgi:hypothetical protein